MRSFSGSILLLQMLSPKHSCSNEAALMAGMCKGRLAATGINQAIFNASECMQGSSRLAGQQKRATRSYSNV